MQPHKCLDKHCPRAANMHAAVASQSAIQSALHSLCQAGLLGSLADVRHSLRGQGSDLVIRVSPLQAAFQEIVQHCSINEIIAEEEVEHRCAAPVISSQGTLTLHFRANVNDKICL